MKRNLWRIVIALTLALCICTSFFAAAQDAIIAQRSEPNIELCGKDAQLETYNVNGSNYVKLRDVASALGLYVSWDEAAQKITVSETPIDVKAKYIMIDAGHGGTETGALNEELGLMEKDINLKVATKLYELLKADGYNVKLTRTDDSTITVSERMQQILVERPDLYVSVHHNASEEQTDEGALVLCQVADEGGGRTTTLAGYLGEEFERIGQTYIGELYRQGQNGDYYGLLRAAAGIGVPAVITEFAFIDNSSDVLKIDSNEDWDAEAQATYNAIKKYLTIFG